ncbi:MAG: DNA-binding protein [Acidilobaceae archaeon]|nr:DNA-binding protein [Acidilobaceae archaeon]MCX8165597.1 DNA-binding protein [Acidilobaceae archaeon]MDW7974024.1 transcription elongation factor subunit Spt4 [Sulfolobales archaeon]
MSQRRAPSRRPPLKACKECATLAYRDVERCENCGSTNFTDDWEGMIVVIRPESSAVARHVGLSKSLMRAIKVSGKVV